MPLCIRGCRGSTVSTVQVRKGITQMGVEKRAHTSRPLHSRLNAAKLFADFARTSFRLDERMPYGKMAEFLRKTSESSLSPNEQQRSCYAMRRAVKLFLSSKVAVPPVCAVGESTGNRRLRFFHRKRRAGHPRCSERNCGIGSAASSGR